MSDPDTVLRLLSPEEVARQLGLTVSNLNQMRYRGKGPVAIKLGHQGRKVGYCN